MAASETAICNLALGHLGISKELASMDSDTSQEAAAFRLYFDEVRDSVLSDFPWPFATKFATLVEVEEDPDFEEWQFSYRYPSDCLHFRRLLSGIRNDTRNSRVPYKIGRDATGKIIYTDLENDDANCEYTIQVTDVTEFSSDFVLMFSTLLAAFVAPRTAGENASGLRKRLFSEYQFFLAQVQNRSFNEEQEDFPVESEFIRERDS